MKSYHLFKFIERSLRVAFVCCLVMFFAVSCDKDKPESEPNEQIAVSLKTNIEPSVLKVANDQWETFDSIGLYMKKAGLPITTAGAVYDNAANRQLGVTGNELTFGWPGTLYYPMENNVDFVAYYPHTWVDTTDYTIPVSVMGQSAGLPVEVLYSNNVTNQAPTTSAVELNFHYTLAKLELTVNGGENSTFTATDFANMTMSIEGMYTQAKLRLSDGIFTDQQNKQPIILHKTGSTSTSATFDALILPTTVFTDEVTFVFNVAGNSYRYKPEGNYDAATCYMLDFKLDFPANSAMLMNANIIPRTVTSRSFTVYTANPMTMTTEAASVLVHMQGTGTMRIDWGDGTANTTGTLWEEGWIEYTHNFSGTLSHTITITGENIISLYCQSNLLTDLDVSKNTALTFLFCYDNLLMNLDVSKNISLSWLSCYSNPLTSIDVSNNTKLKELYCSDNQLTTLDVSNNTELTRLSFDMNQIESLDVNKNIKLEYLSCTRNQLSDIDISKNLLLTDLSCGYNLLTSLDLSNNIALNSLFCDSNPLSNLDVSNNAELTQLSCSNNLLTSIDLSKNIALRSLFCRDNQLASLDVSNNTALYGLYCSSNPIASLDVSNNTALTYLECRNNLLTNLDVSNNTLLGTLWCSNNQLSEGALNSLFGTLHGNTISEGKEIRIGNNPGTTNCNKSIANNNGWAVNADLL